MSPLEVIHLYGIRFKIELSFKQALRVLGTYAYHFWMRAMKPISHRGHSGDRHLHRESDTYRDGVRRKVAAYHRHIQLGLVAQGLLQYLAVRAPAAVWSCFGSWLRTIRPGIPPSEKVTAVALRNALPEFLASSADTHLLANFSASGSTSTGTRGYASPDRRELGTLKKARKSIFAPGNLLVSGRAVPGNAQGIRAALIIASPCEHTATPL